MAASPERLPRRVLREVYGEMHQRLPSCGKCHRPDCRQCFPHPTLFCPCVGCETMRVAERYAIPADKARAIVESLEGGWPG